MSWNAGHFVKFIMKCWGGSRSLGFDEVDAEEVAWIIRHAGLEKSGTDQTGI